MNEQVSDAPIETPAKRTVDIVNAGLQRRYAAERRFHFLGVGAVTLGLLFVAVLFLDIVGKGYTAFQQTYIQLPIRFEPEVIDPTGSRAPDTLSGADYRKLVRTALQARFPEVSGRWDKWMLYRLLSPGAPQQLRERVLADPGLIGTESEVWLLADDDIDMLIKGHIDRAVPESERRVKDRTLGWVDALVADDRLEKKFNTIFFTKGASREPELAGIAGALMGSLYTLALTLLSLFPSPSARPSTWKSSHPRTNGPISSRSTSTT